MARTRNTDSITGSRSEGSHPDGARAHTPTQMADVSHTYAHVPPPPVRGVTPKHAHPHPCTSPRPHTHLPTSAHDCPTPIPSYTLPQVHTPTLTYPDT